MIPNTYNLETQFCLQYKTKGTKSNTSHRQQRRDKTPLEIGRSTTTPGTLATWWLSRLQIRAKKLCKNARNGLSPWVGIWEQNPPQSALF